MTVGGSNEEVCSTDIGFTVFLGLEDEGEDVRELQELLKCLGYFPADQAITGYFGPITEEAVKKFQSANDIDTFGYVGPLTRAALNDYYIY